jgi:hypothetical protein
MSNREEEFGRSLKGYLDQGTADLRTGIAYRLQQARAAALARAGDPARVSEGLLQQAHGLASVGGGPGTRRGERPFFLQARVWLGIVLLTLGMLGYQQWTAWQELQELEDLDAQLLSSDLPIDAYLDRGFQQWLTTGKPEN